MCAEPGVAALRAADQQDVAVVVIEEPAHIAWASVPDDDQHTSRSMGFRRLLDPSDRAAEGRPRSDLLGGKLLAGGWKVVGMSFSLVVLEEALQLQPVPVAACSRSPHQQMRVFSGEVIRHSVPDIRRP